jgi:hypothetical protein
MPRRAIMTLKPRGQARRHSQRQNLVIIILDNEHTTDCAFAAIDISPSVVFLALVGFSPAGTPSHQSQSTQG